MASFPTGNSSDQADSDQEPVSTSPIRATSITSDDSQTVLLDNSPSKMTETSPHTSQESVPPPVQDEEEQKCWICFADASEDTPETSPWRDPCPCALTAHEECLLDWIADKEAPTNTRNSTVGPPKIECPQCRSEIKLSRPKDYLVDLVRSMERVGSMAITPGALALVSSLAYKGSVAWGIQSIYAIFGARDGYRILHPYIFNALRPPFETWPGDPKALQKLLWPFLHRLEHWQLFAGLPMIAPVLILSRTSFADNVLPIFPLIFFATQTLSSEDAMNFNATQWPPSASFAFATLPYARAAYNTLYNHLFLENEKRWLREIQPRANENENEDAEGLGHNGDAQRANVDDENLVELRIDGNIWDDWEDDQPRGARNAPAVPLNQPPIGEDGQVPNLGDAQVPAPAEDLAQQPVQGERRLSFSPTSIAGTVLGALAFPFIAGASGQALAGLLPFSWIALQRNANGDPMSTLPAKGFFQNRWGRSLVGGCLFVVCKDAVMLYVRWKMAQMHRQRHVLNYDRKKKTSKAGE